MKKIRRKTSKVSDEGLTLRQMYKQTPNYIRINSETVNILKIKIKDNQLQALTVDIDKYIKDRVKHKLHITLLSGSKFSAKGSKLCVSCDCEFFLFYCEVVLNKYGAAEIIFSNGKYPHTTNPQGLCCVCKHLTRVFRYLLQKGL